MLLMVEKGIRGGICYTIRWYINNYDKYKDSTYLKYRDINNLYCWAMSQKLPVNNFEWSEDTSKFNEDFIKNSNEESDEAYFLKVDIQHPEKITWLLQWFTIFTWKDENWKNWKACF